MSSDRTGRVGAAGAGGAGAARAAGGCPRDPAHQAVAVQTLYASGRAQIDIAFRHGPAGVQSRSVGQARAETSLSAALAPPVPLPSWQRPARVAAGAGVLLVFLVVATLSSMSEQDLAALELFGTSAVIVAVVAGLTALARRRAHHQFGTAHAAAWAAWNQAMFCMRCVAMWVPGDPRTIGQDRVLGWVLLQRAKANPAHQVSPRRDRVAPPPWERTGPTCGRRGEW